MTKYSWIVPSTTIEGFGYEVFVNTDKKIVMCGCKGFMTHGYCKHIKFYKKLIKELLE